MSRTRSGSDSTSAPGESVGPIGDAHGLDHHEGIPLAGTPYLLTQAGHRRFVASRPRQGPDEAERVRSRQRFERERGHVGLALQLGEGPLGEGRVDEVLLARGDHQEERPGVQSTADEGQQPDGHLVRPVQVFEDQRDRMPFRDVPQEQADSLEEHQVVSRRGRAAVPR